MMKIIATGLLSLLFAGTSFGEWYVFIRSSGDWSDHTTWISASSNPSPPPTLPNSDDQVYVDGARTVTLDVDATIDILNACTRPPEGEGGIIAEQGYALTILRNCNIGRAEELVSGTYKLTDGALSVGGVTTINKTGTLDISGDSTVELGSVSLTGAIKVTGDVASIQIGNLTCNASSSIAFKLGESGVSMIDGSGATINLANSSITVDVSSFTGTQVENITLIQAANLASVSTSLSVINLPAGMEATVIQDQNTDTVYLRVVPPPTLDLILFTK